VPSQFFFGSNLHFSAVNSTLKSQWRLEQLTQIFSLKSLNLGKFYWHPENFENLDSSKNCPFFSTSQKRQVLHLSLRRLNAQHGADAVLPVQELVGQGPGRAPGRGGLDLERPVTSCDILGFGRPCLAACWAFCGFPDKHFWVMLEHHFLYNDLPTKSMLEKCSMSMV